MKDGIYQVTTPYLSAGFIVEGGEVTACAPILRRRLKYWMTKAVRLSDEKKNQEERKHANSRRKNKR